MITVKLIDGNETMEGFQLWNLSPIPLATQDEFIRLNHIKCNEIPMILIQNKPMEVYSTMPQSITYIENNLLKYENLGLLFKHHNNDNIYLIFYIQELKLKCLILDFSTIDKILNFETLDDREINYIIDVKPNVANTNVFDKVLEKKKRPKSTTPTIQDQGDQINSMITKVILSGLRLRGLSNSNKDKIKLKEIYQITYKSTIFALRKFNHDHDISLPDIQDIVEKLLQVFVDVDEESPFIQK